MATDKDPEIGDLIEIFRPLGYQHWAVYVGDGYVIHLASLSVAGSSSGSSSSGSPVGEDEAIVKREKLKDVAGRDKYRVSNLLDDQRKPRPIQDILKEAKDRVGHKLPYSLLGNNCEHFVTLLRYGTPESQQVENLDSSMNAMSIAVAAANLLGPVGFLFYPVIKLSVKNSKKEEKKNLGGLVCRVGE